MQQTSLDLDTDRDAAVDLEMDPERIQRLIALMAEALLSVLDREADHEPA